MRTDPVSDLVAIQWFRNQRLTTGYLVVLDRKRYQIRATLSHHLQVHNYIDYEGS